MPACSPARDWDPAAAAFEDDVLERMASLRRQRPVCPGAAWPGPGDLQVEDGALTCAARIHALDMATEAFVGHEGSDGSTPEDRVARTGAVFFAVHEAIVAGAPSPAAAVDLLAGDPEDCAAMVGPTFDRVGAGYAPDPSGTSSGYLVVVFAATASAGTTGGSEGSSGG